jgi:hypothetical protein
MSSEKTLKIITNARGIGSSTLEDFQEQFKPENADEVRQEVIEELGAEAWNSDKSLTDKAEQRIQSRTDGYKNLSE